MYFIQESACGYVNVSRQIIQTASGEEVISLNMDVISSHNYYKGRYGTLNPESVCEKDGMVYFVDKGSAKVIRIDSQGVTDLSGIGVSSFFQTKLRDLHKHSSTRIVGGYDDDTDMYILSGEDAYSSQVVINDGEYSYNVNVNESGEDVTGCLLYTSDAADE